MAVDTGITAGFPVWLQNALSVFDSVDPSSQVSWLLFLSSRTQGFIGERKVLADDPGERESNLAVLREFTRMADRICDWSLLNPASGSGQQQIRDAYMRAKGILDGR